MYATMKGIFSIALTLLLTTYLRLSSRALRSHIANAKSSVGDLPGSMDLASDYIIVSKEYVSEMDTSSHYNWVQNLGNEK